MGEYCPGNCPVRCSLGKFVWVGIVQGVGGGVVVQSQTYLEVSLYSYLPPVRENWLNIDQFLVTLKRRSQKTD